MTLNDLKRQNRGFYRFFWRFQAATQVYIIHKVEPRNCHYVHFGMTVIKVLYFIPNSRKSNSNSDRNFCCSISLYCERNNLLFSTFLMHSIWWNGLHILYSIICDILLDDAATSGIGLQRPALTNADWFHWLTCYIFTRKSSYCFYRVSAIAILSVRLSVCLSVCPSDRHTGGTRYS